MPNKTMDQKRAAYAWECTAGTDRDYKNLAKGAPALIMGNGLMQALCYWQGKSAQGKQLVKDLCLWLQNQCGVGEGKFHSFMVAIQEADGITYLRVTDEALEILRWIRQFVDARETSQASSSSTTGEKGDA